MVIVSEAPVAGLKIRTRTRSGEKFPGFAGPVSNENRELSFPRPIRASSPPGHDGHFAFARPATRVRPSRPPAFARPNAKSDTGNARAYGSAAPEPSSLIAKIIPLYY